MSRRISKLSYSLRYPILTSPFSLALAVQQSGALNIFLMFLLVVTIFTACGIALNIGIVAQREAEERIYRRNFDIERYFVSLPEDD